MPLRAPKPPTSTLSKPMVDRRVASAIIDFRDPQADFDPRLRAANGQKQPGVEQGTNVIVTSDLGARAAHVLVVDDDAAQSRVVAATVRTLGYEASEANTWTHALQKFTTERIDLILMDATMPTVDGFKLTKILRSRAHSYVPILFLTASQELAAREQAVSVGADDFLTKPVDAFELKVRLAAMLRIRQLTQDLEAKTKILAQLANYDALTGIENRRSFDEKFPIELERAQRYGRPLGILIADIDHFKRINDEHGHAMGDAVLAFFGRLLGEVTRNCDQVFRYGGEEFVILAPETTAEQAVHIADRIRLAFELRSPGATSAGKQTMSIGVSGTDLFEAQIERAGLLESADTALYRAKAEGRNRVVCFDPAVDERAA